MKLYATSTLLLPVLAFLSGSEAANRHAGTRRTLDLSRGHVGRGLPHHANVKRVPIAVDGPIEVGPKMRTVKRHPRAFAATPVAAKRSAAAYGAVPIMNAGTAPIVGLVGKRDIALNFAHNGQQGTAVDAETTTSDSDNTSSSTGSTGSTTASSDDDEEDCEEEDDDEDDEEDCDAEDDDEDDDEENCDDEDDTDASSGSTTSTTASTSTESGTIEVQVNAKNVAAKSSSSSSSSSAPTASASSESKSSSNSQSFTGIATWYTQNGNAGNCGKVNPDSAKIIALYTEAYENGANCGRTVQIDNLDDGTSTTAVVADSCPSCSNSNNIDLSVGAFEAIDPEYKTHGIRNIRWHYIS